MLTGLVACFQWGMRPSRLLEATVPRELRYGREVVVLL